MTVGMTFGMTVSHGLSGMALTDLFYLNTYAWEDDVEDLPIKYRFGYVSGSADESDTSSEVILRPAMESSEVRDVILPQVGNNTFIYIYISRLELM